MTLHEVVGHGVLCYAASGHTVLSSVATQCQIQPWPMVLAGPAFNVIAGAALALRIPASPRTDPVWWQLLWLVMAFNLLIAAGYLLLGGLAGFGDWAVLAGLFASPGVWRPVAAGLGAAAYYLGLRLLARHLIAVQPTADRLRGLVGWPYLGAGIVALAAGALNPIDLVRRLLLPVASSLGAGFGLLRIPDLVSADSSVPPTERLGPVCRSWPRLALTIAWLLLFVVVLGRGLAL